MTNTTTLLRRWGPLVAFGGLVACAALAAERRNSANTTAPANVTFNKDIAPVVFHNCTTCHRPSEAAPFALMNFDDVQKRGRLIALVTQSRQMPPWKAGAADYELKGDRRLTEAQIELIQQWVAGGMKQGTEPLPPLPQFPEGWQLGKPDLVVKMPEAFQVPAEGPDIYRNFVLPLNLLEDKWLKGIEFRPTARTVVHHSLFFMDTTGNARKLDKQDPLPGFRGAMGAVPSGNDQNRPGLSQLAGLISEGGPGANAGGSLGGWAVGAQARALPEGLAYHLPKTADLILSTHFHPSGKVEQEASTVGLYFSDKPPTRSFTGVQLPPAFGVFAGIDIPAGAREYVIEDSLVLPVEVKAYGVGAHAHYLGKDMKMTATLPTGLTKTLLRIPDWDFAWQEQYQFKDFVTLPAGTRLHVRISYDNSAENPRNPNNPPKRVRWGRETTDEMGSVGLRVVANSEAELQQVRQAYRQHLREALMNGSLPGRRPE